MRKKIKLKKLNIFIFIVLIVCIVSFVCNFIKIIKWNTNNKETNEIINEIEEKIEIQDNIATIQDDKEISNKVTYDFNLLKDINNQTIAWLKVNGTNIDYPVVQSKDNSYYLNHSFDKTYNDAGWIFLDYRNDIYNLGKNNIIYGHARLDKSMFGSLKNTLKENWFNDKNNHIINLFTETETMTFEIFSVYHLKTENYYITTDFTSSEFAKFINTLKDRSIYEFDNEVTLDDRILTLSTCYKTDQKLVVHAKLIKKETSDSSL